MAELIPMDKLTELKSASEVKEVANEAASIHEEHSVAAAINQAANSGQHRITWNHPISDDLKEKLKSKGYSVTQNLRAADPTTSYTIAGF